MTQEHFDVRKELGQSADRRAEHRRASDRGVAPALADEKVAAW
jgi:hypothetical protein